MEMILKKLLSNFNLKIMAFLVAMMVWYFAQKELTVSIDKNVDIRIFPPDGYVLVFPKKYSALVTVSGHAHSIKPLRGRDLKAFIAIKEKKEGFLNIELHREHLINLEEDIEVDIREHTTFSVQMDRLITKTVPVRINLMGLPQHKFYIKRVLTEPQAVELKGARSLIEKISFISNTSLDVTGLQATQTYKVPLGSNFPAGMQIFPEHARVTLVVDDAKPAPLNTPGFIPGQGFMP